MLELNNIWNIYIKMNKTYIQYDLIYYNIDIF